MMPLGSTVPESTREKLSASTKSVFDGTAVDDTEDVALNSADDVTTGVNGTTSCGTREWRSMSCTIAFLLEDFPCLSEL